VSLGESVSYGNKMLTFLRDRVDITNSTSDSKIEFRNPGNGFVPSLDHTDSSTSRVITLKNYLYNFFFPEESKAVIFGVQGTGKTTSTFQLNVKNGTIAIDADAVMKILPGTWKQKRANYLYYLLSIQMTHTARYLFTNDIQFMRILQIYGYSRVLLDPGLDQYVENIHKRSDLEFFSYSSLMKRYNDSLALKWDKVYAPRQLTSIIGSRIFSGLKGVLTPALERIESANEIRESINKWILSEFRVDGIVDLGSRAHELYSLLCLHMNVDKIPVRIAVSYSFDLPNGPCNSSFDLGSYIFLLTHSTRKIYTYKSFIEVKQVDNQWNLDESFHVNGESVLSHFLQGKSENKRYKLPSCSLPNWIVFLKDIFKHNIPVTSDKMVSGSGSSRCVIHEGKHFDPKIRNIIILPLGSSQLSREVYFLPINPPKLLFVYDPLCTDNSMLTLDGKSQYKGSNSLYLAMLPGPLISQDYLQSLPLRNLKFIYTCLFSITNTDSDSKAGSGTASLIMYERIKKLYSLYPDCICNFLNHHHIAQFPVGSVGTLNGGVLYTEGKNNNFYDYTANPYLLQCLLSRDDIDVRFYDHNRVYTMARTRS